MKNQKWLTLSFAVVLPAMVGYAQPAPPPDAAPVIAEQPGPQVPTELPAGAAEVVRLSESGTSEDVMLSYIHNSSLRYNLSADQILYLRDIGFSSQVISAMLNREHELQNAPQTYTYEQKLYTPANPAAVAPQPVAPAPSQPVTPVPTAAPAPPPTYVSSPPADVSYFYDSLSPYGTWVQLDDVGWCWQPRVVVVNHGWRPYCDSGYWVYSDAGWYWQSSYSWGWAPFHYGRWQLHPRCGWVWLPDRVWGPSWVLWRSEGDHCGWAPLPPHAVFDVGIGWRFNGVRVAVDFDFGLRPDHFTFIAFKDFTNHDLGHHRLAPTEVTRIYRHTTVVNNYVVNNNRTIVNQGFKVDRVATATHTQINRVAIRDVPAGSRPPREQAPGRPGGVIYRPQLAAPTPARGTHMVAQKIDDRHPVVQHAPVVAANNPRPAQSVERSRTAPSAAPAPRTPPARNEPRPVTQPQRSEPARPAPSAKPVRPTAPRDARSTSESQRPGQYYPKGYRQASEVHSLPPLNQPADSNSSQGRGNPGQRGRNN